MGNAFTSPVKTFCKKTGINYKKQTIRDHAADQRAHELNASRQNNKYISKVKNTGNFANLEDAVAYKEWLTTNGPENLHSPYYSSVETQTKQHTSVLGVNGHPNVHINWENRFNHDSYNRDLHNAEETIQSCKQQIYQEGIRFEQIIVSSERQQQESQQEIAQLKSIYDSCRREYSVLCNKNSQLNTQLNNQLSILGSKKSEYASKSEQLNELKSQVKNLAQEQGINAYYKEEDVLSEIEIREAKELTEQLQSLTVQDRTKLLFEIFSDESQTDICNIIKSLGIDIDLLAYMACEFNKNPILEFALDKGASLDNNVGSGETTIETILKSDNPEQIELMLSHSNGFIYTIINAAEHNRFDVLSKIYQLDNNAFANSDISIIGYTPIHVLLLGNHISAFEHVISIAPECLDAKTLKGESLLKVGLRSASDEILPLLISKYNNIGDQIKSFIASDEDELAKKLMDHIKLNIETVADNILYAVEKGRDDLAKEFFEINNPKQEEIVHYIEKLRGNESATRFLDNLIGISASGHVDTDSLADELALIELAGQTEDFLLDFDG